MPGINPALLLLFPLCLLPLLLKKDGFHDEKEFFKRQRWGGAEAAISVVLMQALQSAFYALKQSESIYAVLYKHYSLISLLPFIYVLLLFRFKVRASITLLGFRRRSICMNIFFVLAFSVPLLFVTILDVPALLLYLKGLLIRRAIIEPSFSVTRFLARAQVNFGYLVTTPLAEESIFRGILYAPLRRKYHPLGAILLTSLFFITMHINPTPAVVVGGVIPAVLYEKTGSFTALVIVHTIANSLALAIHAYLPG
jgi:membrane protease YdiL (CAAX protease family)